jgi:organic hydroperoxide reductase OsmC/OhrA
MSIRQPSHVFEAHVVWSGAERGPTRDAATFSRDLDVSFDAVTLAMSAAPGFRGDASRANPEQLFVAAVSSCQALTYLFLAARKGVAVVGYEDVAEGILESVDGALRMSRVTLRPRIVLEAGADVQLARDLVDRAHRGCFIANSVSTAVDIEPRIELGEWVEAVKGVL